MLSRAEREELKALSKEVFGVSSKYQKYIEGIRVLRTREVTEEVPGENGAEPTTRTAQVPVLEGLAKQYDLKRYSFEECRDMLLNFKTQIAAIKAEQKRLQDEEAAKKAQEALQKEVQNKIGGSVI